MVIDPTGTIVARSRIPIEAYEPGQPPGVAEQDAEVYWRALGDACQARWADPNARRDTLAGVALTTQRGTVVVTDRDGQPLRAAMIWLDRRRAEGLPPMGGIVGLAFKVLRVDETVATLRAE